MKKRKLAALTFAFIFALNTNVFAKSSVKASTPDTEKVSQEEEIKTLTVEEAVELAIKNSKNLKTIEENQSISEDDLKDTSSDLRYASEYAEVTSFAVQLRNLTNRIANYKASTEIEKQSIELSIIQVFVSIIEAEDKLDLYDQQIALDKKQLDISKLKVDLGLLSQSDYDEQLNSYNKTVAGRESLKNSIDEAYISLNKVLGVDLDKKYKIELDIEYEPLGDVNLQTVIMKALSTNQSIKEKEDAAEVAKYEYEVFSSLYMSGTKEEKEAAYSQSTRAVSDAKTALEQNIRKLYNSIINIETEYNTKIEDLELKKSQLELKELQLSLGKITEIELEDFKYQITSLESNIKSNIYSHDILVRQFNNSDLIS